MFVAEPWMAAQVEDLLHQIANNRFAYTVNTHGEGFFQSALKHNTLEAVYDLNLAPGSWDFIWSLMSIENVRRDMGYSRVKVHFKSGSDKGFRPNEVIDLNHSQKSGMLNNVVRPMLKMFGMEEASEVSESAIPFDYAPRHVVECFKETGKLARFYPSIMARKWALGLEQPYVTITLRECSYWPQRNSDIAEWIKFAKKLDRKVIFVRDTANAYEPIDGFDISPSASKDVDYRLALYRRAEMNFGVNNGPCGFGWAASDIPYLTFNTMPDSYVCNDPVWWRAHMGIDIGEQWPWHNPAKQRMIWAKDTSDNIAAAWRVFQ